MSLSACVVPQFLLCSNQKAKLQNPYEVMRKEPRSQLEVALTIIGIVITIDMINITTCERSGTSCT